MALANEDAAGLAPRWRSVQKSRAGRGVRSLVKLELDFAIEGPRLRRPFL